MRERHCPADSGIERLDNCIGLRNEVVDGKGSSIGEHHHDWLSEREDLHGKRLLQTRQGGVCAIQGLMFLRTIIAENHDDDIGGGGSSNGGGYRAPIAAVHVNACASEQIRKVFCTACT